MADWYVYQHDGDPLGPWSTEAIADQILAGKLAPDVWVAAPCGQRWLRALDVPVLSRLVDGMPTKPVRRESGLRLRPSAFVTENGVPSFGSTMMIVRDDELERSAIEAAAVHPEPSSSAKTRRGAQPARVTANLFGFAPVAEATPTERELPPSSKTPRPPTPRALTGTTSSRRSRKNG